MKHVILALFIALGVSAALSGCERNDYQHPMHRSK